MPACPACGTDNPDNAKFCLECGRRFAAARPDVSESRRTVTVLFSDIVGSTALGEALDPEALRGVMTRYFEAMETVLERHGGSVEKFIGDAIMAVFGLRTIHEDDAVRAVRAAVEMRDALSRLNAELLAERDVTIATRTGLHTGEVVAGDPSARQTLVTGDAVNTAARLEQAAGPGEILIGEPTWRLVRDFVDTEPVPPVGAKGKAEPVPARRVMGLRPAAEPGSGSSVSRLFGRRAEIEQLDEAFERAVADRRATRVTVVGPAGVGKSRLVLEFLAGRAGEATILRGRCLPYGEGITYWPLREILHAAARIRDSDPPGVGVAKLEDLLEEAPEGRLLAGRLASAIGLSVEAARQEEIFWAARRALEHLARHQPLVIVVEDIHWAEATLLELLDQLVDMTRDAALLIVCPARPEYRHVSAAGGLERHSGTTIVLEGLPGDVASALFDGLPGASAIPAGLRARILATAEGNPLFVEEIVAMLVEGGALTARVDDAVPGHALDELIVPPTIHALMAARVDALPIPERSVAQRASVVGRAFERDAVEAITPPDTRPEVRGSLLELMRRELVTPEPSPLSVADAYKFRHILIRDAAYDALRKADRAALHEGFADWLERAAGDRVAEYQEILGYHLGQAHRYRVELRESGLHTVEVGRRAGAHLAAAAKRARDRGDSAAAVRLYRGAEELPSGDDRARADLRLEHGMALFDLGRAADAGVCAADALALAVGAADHRSAARARLLRLEVSISEGALTTFDQAIKDEVDAALRDAEAADDPRALAEAWQMIGNRAWYEARHADSAAATRKALEHARGAGDPRYELDIELNILVETFAGPTPIDAVAEAASALVARGAAYPTVRAEAQEVLAVSEAMRERFEAGEAYAEDSIRILADLAQQVTLVNARTYLAWVHRLAGDFSRAETILREGLSEARAIGDRSLESFVSCRLAEALVAQGRFDDAANALVTAERDPIGATHSRIIGARARIKAAHGDRSAMGEIERLLALVADGPWLNVRTEAYIDASHAMAALGERGLADRYGREALRMCEEKGDLALARRTAAFLAGMSG